jgi:hypothetical protein
VYGSWCTSALYSDGTIAALQVTFKVSVPAGVSQALNVTAMLLHEKIIGFDQRASITLPPMGRQQGRRGPAAHNSSRQLPGSNGATVAEDPSSQDGAVVVGAWGEDSAAAEAAARPRASRRATAAAGEAAGEDGEGGDSAHEGLAAAAEGYALLHHKQQLRAKRAREAAAAGSNSHAEDADGVGSRARLQLGTDTPTNAHGLGSMLPPAKRPRGSRHAALGAPTLDQKDEQQQQPYHSAEHSPHRQLEQPPHYDLRGSASFPDSMDVGPTATATAVSDQDTAAPLQSSVAARYRSIFSSAAGGQPSNRQQGPSHSRCTAGARAAPACRLGGLDMEKGLVVAAPLGAVAGACRVSGASSGSATAAMDSGELQASHLRLIRSAWGGARAGGTYGAFMCC